MRSQFVAGDSINYSAVVPDYPAADGWVLKLRFVPRNTGGAAYTATSTTAADGSYVVRVVASITAAWPPGPYSWSTWVERADERYTQASGQITVQADPSSYAVGTDTRSHAARTLDAVEATLEGRATQAQLEIEINGRRLKYTPMADLLAVRDRYKWEVRSEEAVARGQPAGGAGKLLVRL